MSKKARVKVAKTVYITAAQDKALHQVAKRTGLSIAEIIRRGVDIVLTYDRPPKKAVELP